jgi:hypothetical protein
MADEDKVVPDKDKTSQDQPDGGKRQDDPPKWVNDLFTRIGRVDAETKKRFETLESKFDGLRTHKPDGDVKPDDINRELTERILGNDPMGAIESVIAKREKAKEMLVKQDQAKLEKLIGGLDEAPLFKDVKEKVREIAADFVFKRGYSPEDAVGYAYEKARADFLMTKFVGGNTGGIDSGSLETSGGGSVREDTGAKKGKLNAEGKKAWEKNKPYFKDEAEFIASMSSQVRARFVG